MNCYLHPERTATAYCRTCGRPLCQEDQREIYGVVYCQECVTRQWSSSSTGGAYAPPPPSGSIPVPPGAPSPGVALALGFIPGVGAIYNGQYFKAFLHVVIFGFLIAMSNGPLGALFGIGIAAFYFYMVIDSFRTARAICLGQPVEDFPGLGTIQFNAPIGAIILIGVGVLLLLHSLGWMGFDFLRYVWPIFLIVLGLLLLQKHQNRV